jgi:hypothetical protein
MAGHGINFWRNSKSRVTRVTMYCIFSP